MDLEKITKEINPKKELFKWGPVDFRIFYGSFFIETLGLEVRKYYQWPWPLLLGIFDHKTLVFIADYDDLKNTGAKYFKKYFLDFKNYQKHWQLWRDWIKEYKRKEDGYLKMDFSKLPDKELKKLFKDFYKFNINFWLIVHVPEIANWGGEYLLKKELQRRFKEKAGEYLEILSAPVKFSFFQKEELDLLKLAFIKNKKEFKEALAKHAEKYNWLLNSYGGDRILKPDYFDKKLQGLLKEKSARRRIKEIEKSIKDNQSRKRELIKKLKLDKKTVLRAEQLSQSIWWQDLRKSYIWRMQHIWDKILREASKRHNWNFENLLWCWPEEILDILRSKKINEDKILARKKYYAFFYNQKNKAKELYGKEAQKLIEIYLKQEISEREELKGAVVSKGKNNIIKGRVKIIRNPFKESAKMKKGDILITGMTSPEYIIVMRKAKAVITDHGGMTSHAAIVSRELKIPCIVDTKVATGIFKDGDMVEVDADKGIVKKLK